jgi:hypothetical protein
MTVDTKPMLPAITQAGEPWEPKTLEVLEAYPEAKFNQLLPTVQVRQVNPFLVPDMEVVQLKESDIYHSNDMKDGEYAPTANGLGKLADVAGVSVLDSRRMDDGKDPDVVEWRVEIEMITPSGRPRRAMGSKRIDLHQLATGWSAARLAKAREHLVANAETKALNRALRGVLSLHGAYRKVELLKPFAILRYVPDMSQPEVRQAFLGQLVPAADRLYGPANGEQPKQLTSSEVETAPEAPEEDPAPARDDVDADGVKIEEPDWGTSSEPAADAATDEPPEPRILISLRERADASEAKGAPTAAQREQLKSATAGIGIEAVQRVLIALWNLKTPGDITAAQAHAILDDAETRGKTFVAEWRAAAVWLKEGEAS